MVRWVWSKGLTGDRSSHLDSLGMALLRADLDPDDHLRLQRFQPMKLALIIDGRKKNITSTFSLYRTNLSQIMNNNRSNFAMDGRFFCCCVKLRMEFNQVVPRSYPHLPRR